MATRRIHLFLIFNLSRFHFASRFVMCTIVQCNFCIDSFFRVFLGKSFIDSFRNSFRESVGNVYRHSGIPLKVHFLIHWPLCIPSNSFAGVATENSIRNSFKNVSEDLFWNSFMNCFNLFLYELFQKFLQRSLLIPEFLTCSRQASKKASQIKSSCYT